MELTDSLRVGTIPLLHRAPVAQLDRAPGYELGGRRFESFRARHSSEKSQPSQVGFFLFAPSDCRPAAVRRAFVPARSYASQAAGSHPSGRATLQKKANLPRLVFFFSRPRIAGPPQCGGRSSPREATLRRPRGLTLPGAPLFRKKPTFPGWLFLCALSDCRPAAARRGGCGNFQQVLRDARRRLPCADAATVGACRSTPFRCAAGTRPWNR
jgi:hypothetical protein